MSLTSPEFVIRAACIIVCVTMIWRLLRCVHAWELVDKSEFPPAIDSYKRAGGSSLHWGMISQSAAQRMSRKTVMLALRCSRCGAARIYKESA